MKIKCKTTRYDKGVELPTEEYEVGIGHFAQCILKATRKGPIQLHIKYDKVIIDDYNTENGCGYHKEFSL